MSHVHKRSTSASSVGEFVGDYASTSEVTETKQKTNFQRYLVTLRSIECAKPCLAMPCVLDANFTSSNRCTRRMTGRRPSTLARRRPCRRESRTWIWLSKRPWCSIRPFSFQEYEKNESASQRVNSTESRGRSNIVLSHVWLSRQDMCWCSPTLLVYSRRRCFETYAAVALLPSSLD